MTDSAVEGLRAALLQANDRERGGNRHGAIDSLRHALALAPDYAPAHAHLGLLLLEGGLSREAVPHLTRAVELRPADAQAWNNLAVAHLNLGQFVAAERAARGAIAQRADYAWALYNLGRALEAQGRADDARDQFAAAVRIDAGNALAWEELGTSWMRASRLERARDAFLGSIAANPGRASAWSRLGVAELHLGRSPEAAEAMQRAAALGPPDAAQIASARLVALHYHAMDRDALFEEHRDWARRYASARPKRAFANDRSKTRRLRIGYVSPRFHESSLAHLLEPVLAHHDPAAVEVWCYASQAIDDEVTARLRKLCTRWVDVLGLGDEALAERMRADRIDIAVDLAGHTPGHRLTAFAHGLAPVCATWLDYFNTTGVEGMDFFLTDASHSPVGDGQRFSERLVRLPRVRFCYEPPANAPEPAATRGARRHPVLGSFVRMAKISDATLEAWRRAMERLPDAELVVKSSALEHADERARFAARARERGIDPARLALRGHSSHLEMLAQYNDIDVVLDTFPYNGGVTTLEALWMGRPVATMRGDTLISRQSAALLEAVGLDELIAEDVDGFAEITAGLARDAGRLEELARTLRGRMRASPLFDPRGLAQALEATYRELWRRRMETA